MNSYSKGKTTIYKRIHKTFYPYMEISTNTTSYLIYESGNRKAASTQSNRNSMQISHHHHSHINGKDISVKRWQRSGCWGVENPSPPPSIQANWLALGRRRLGEEVAEDASFYQVDVIFYGRWFYYIYRVYLYN